MKVLMRAVLALVCAPLLCVLFASAHAQPWPSKAIRYIVPFAPGGTTDILGRMVAAGLSSFNVASVRELVELLKANPNKYSFGSAGNGTSQHISGELFKIMTGTQMQHIPYKGSGPMIPDLLAGTIQLSFENITTAYPQVKGGKLKALAVTSSKRSFVAPEVPTMAEAGLAGYDISSWQAMYAPAGTPRDIVARLHAETVKALRSPENQKKLSDLGLDAGGMAPEELAALMRADIPRLGKVVRESGAKVD